MPQTKHEIQTLLDAAGMRPRHRFGQNFMIDQNLVRLVADAGDIHPADLIVEVGPGTGTLSEEILARGARLLAVEIDRDLANLLRTRFASESRFSLIEADALESKHRLNPALLAAMETARDQNQPVKLVANLPYNIASPLIIEMLIAGAAALAFTVQKEVADRLRAPAGSDAYGVLSVMTQLLSDVRVLRTLPPQAFWPAPTIESSLVQLIRLPTPLANPGPFNSFLQQLFSARRKTLRKGLTQAGHPADALLHRANIDGQKRPEEIPPADLVKLFQATESP